MTLRRPPKGTPPLYAQDGQGYDALVYAHYSVGECDWFATEYDPGEDVAFGWACLHGDRQNAELGYFSLAELASVRMHGIWPVYKEDGWQPVTLSQAIAELDRKMGVES